MFDGWFPRAITVWLLLMALSLPATVMAEGSNHAAYTIIAILVIAAAKSDLVIMHYRAAPHWNGCIGVGWGSLRYC